jgi:hypothetical protein
MTKRLDKLVQIGSASIGSMPPDMEGLADVYGNAVAQLDAMLQRRNGFYAFENALHVLPDSGSGTKLGLIEWNDHELWRKDYEGMADGALFFAEDVFGVQFCLRDNSICTFDPETGAMKPMATNLEEWASIILEEYSVWTGYKLAHEWQSVNGALPAGSRLVPFTPFVCGGEFAVSNMYVLDAVQGMRLRASIATQIRDLPDGATIEFHVVKS